MTVERRGGNGVEACQIERPGEIFELKANLEKAIEALRIGRDDFLGPEEASGAIAVCLAAGQSAASGAITAIEYDHRS